MLYSSFVGSQGIPNSVISFSSVPHDRSVGYGGTLIHSAGAAASAAASATSVPRGNVCAADARSERVTLWAGATMCATACIH
jgi:hypothetical protein